MGKTVNGVVKRVFASNDRPAYTLELVAPVEVDGESTRTVNVGGMKGFEMALQAAGLTMLVFGDKVSVTATGSKPADKPGHSAMVLFDVEVTRNGKVYRGKSEDAGDPFLGAKFWGV